MSEQSKPNMFFKAAQLILYFFFKLFFRLEVSGRNNVPANGGVLIAMNHLSLWDPPLVGGAMPRMIKYMAKEELFKIPALGGIIKIFGAFPVKRGGNDRNAVRMALSLLKNGEAVGIFPEGKRNKTGQLSKAEPGVALIAAKAQVPIIPTAIIGANKIFSLKHGFLPKLKVKFGTPLAFDKGKADKEALDGMSNKIMSEIFRLIEEK